MQTRHPLYLLIQRMLPCLVAFSAVLLVSCYPYPEGQPKHKSTPAVAKPPVAKTEADKLKEQDRIAKEKKAKDELKKTAAEKEKNEPDPDQTAGITEPPDKKPEPVKRAEYEVARKVPGKEGFVLSPYNKKLIDVRGFKSGDLVRDPTYDPAEKKYFRVP